MWIITSPFGIAVKHILIAVVSAVVASSIISLFRTNRLESFLSSAPSIATGLLAVASFWSAREGFVAGQRAAGHRSASEPAS